MTAASLATLVEGKWVDEAAAEPDREIVRASSFADARADAVVFATDEGSLQRALESGAGVVLAGPEVAAAFSNADARVLLVRDAKYAFAQCGRALQSDAGGEWIHPRAVVDEAARLGSGVRVGPGAVIEAAVAVGAGSRIGPNVTVYAGTTLGERVVVQAGAVLGGSGFGYVRNPATGEYLLFPQQGTLQIEDDVEIGANTTIDRGALGATRIGRGTKIDNGVHIGHNCDIGRNVVIAAQAGISGSCVVGDGAVLAGQVGLGDHVTIGPGVILGGAAGVFPHKHVEGPGQMFMGVPAEPLKDYLKSLAKVRRLK